LGFIAYVEIAYAVSDQDSLAPDVSVVRKIRVIEGEDRIISGAPEVAVEVVSPTDTATHIKAKVAAYLSGGSQTVWVAYPQMKVVDVHSAAVLHEVKGEQPIEDDLLPGFSVPVSRFFEGL
jgi:Uma2 family endonuclease